MRVRPTADSIRDLERLLAIDEAAGSRGMLPGTPDHTHITQAQLLSAATESHEKPQQLHDTVSHGHWRVPSKGLAAVSGTVEHC